MHMYNNNRAKGESNGSLPQLKTFYKKARSNYRRCLSVFRMLGLLKDVGKRDRIEVYKMFEK